jgi:hypothetical protein
LEVPDLGLSPVTDGGMLQSRPDAEDAFGLRWPQVVAELPTELLGKVPETGCGTTQERLDSSSTMHQGIEKEQRHHSEVSCKGSER